MGRKLSVAEIGLCFFFPALVLGLIFYFQPFWGIMDDYVNLLYVRQMKDVGFFKTYWIEASADLFGSGRMRFTNIPMVLALYGPSMNNSLVTFAINAIFVSGIFLFTAYVFGISADMLGLKIGRSEFVGLFFLFCFAYPWSQHLFLSPSVQEKLVILASVALIWLLFRIRDLSSNLLWALSIFVLLVFAVNTKEQIVLFFPLLLAIQLQIGREGDRYLRFGLLFFLLVVAVASIYWAGTFGYYKRDRYGLEAAMATLRTSKSMWLFLGLAGLAEFFVIRRWIRERNLFQFLHRSAYPLGLLLFVLLMLPWGLGNYLNTVALVFVFFSLYFVVEAFFPPKLIQRALFPAMALASLASSLFFLAPGLSAAGDLGNLLASDSLKSVGSERINIPCEEGATRIQQYAKMFHNLDLTVELAREVGNEFVKRTGGLWIVSSLRCTNGANFGELEATGQVENLFRGRFSSGFQIFRVLGKQ